MKKIFSGLLLTLVALASFAQITVTKATAKVRIQSTSGIIAVDSTSFGFDAGPTYIRFHGTGMTTMQCLYTDLTVGSTQAVNRQDAINKLNAYFPSIAVSNDPIVTTVQPAKRIFGLHVMDAFLHHTGSIYSYFAGLKAQGYNVVWLFFDEFSDPSQTFYESNGDSAFNACDKLGGIYIMPGFMDYGTTGSTTGTNKARNLIARWWDRASLLRIDGKRVFAGYNYAGEAGTFNQIDLHNQLLTLGGYLKSDWYLVAQMQYPYSFDDRATWQGAATGANSVPKWSIAGWHNKVTGFLTDMNHAIDGWPWVDGVMMFAGDMDSTTIVGTNDNLAEMAKSRKLPAGYWAGLNAWYTSASFYRYGLDGIAAMVAPMIKLPINRRPAALMVTTANDFIEQSYTTLFAGTSGGTFSVPSLSASYRIGLREPLLNHAGWQEFVRPFVDAFLNDQDSAYFPANRIFSFYMLHPKTASFITTAPSAFTSQGGLFTQNYWQGSGGTGVPSIAQPAYNGNAIVTGIKAMANVDDIQMGAHIAPNQSVYLKINSTLSSLFTVGPYGGYATFRIPLSSFTGSPVFSIIASDGTTVLKTATGVGITGSAYPGQWNILSEAY